MQGEAGGAAGEEEKALAAARKAERDRREAKAQADRAANSVRPAFLSDS